MSEDLRAKQASDADLGAALHEVGNGLTVILGWLDSAREAVRAGLDRRADAEDALRDALRGIEVAARRVRRAHRIARRSIGALPGAESAPEPLSDVVEEALTGVLPHAEHAGVSIDSKLDRSVRSLDVEAGERLLQVLTNLLLNAIAVTPRGARVLVTAALGSEGGVALAVEDAGPGIAPLDRGKVFVRGTTSRADGAGIGLAHAMTLTEEEGGRLGLAPFAPDKGARFELDWPAVAQPSGESPHTIRPPTLDRLEIAVLDDDLALVELLDTFLTSRGATVRACRTAIELESLLGAGADVVLLDASPFGGDLPGALARLKHAHPRTDFVLISGADPGPLVTGLG
ncbi:MAG TPA: ATP-binding protein, partial [Polyangiaceae bacterium]|nr:ATP-binding protein [Polyangiaceae bacterium]